MSRQVVLTRSASYKAGPLAGAMDRQFELLGVPKMVRPGDLVLVKPNMIAPSPADLPVQTHPAVIAQAVRCLRDLGARVLVGDSPAWGTVKMCAGAMGLEPLLAPMGAQVCRLDRPVWRTLPDGMARVRVSSVVLEADMVLNLPKFKAHQQLMFTFAVKNLFGCVPGKSKPLWHWLMGQSRQRFSQFLVRLCRLIGPDVTIIDAVVAMEGPGPISGSPVRVGYLIGARDPLAAEVVCARIVGVNPAQVPIISAARDLGIGGSGDVELLGDLPIEVCRGFRVPGLIPVRFSPLRVARSLAKGALVLARGRFGRLL